MSEQMGVIHDPLYGAVQLTGLARQLIDTPAFQRLRRIKQLGMASWVYPSAVHTRFEHSLGAYHTVRVVLAQMAERGELAQAGLGEEDVDLLTAAVLVHDTGHHPGAHLLEEFGYPGACHEKAGEKWFTSGALGEVLRASRLEDAPQRIAGLVQGASDHPLAGLVSGACDVDKIDYIARDAYHCGLAMGFERERLLHCLTLAEDPETGRTTVALRRKGLFCFEQLLYAKFNLFRSVYFHRAVRSATVMMRALVIEALESGVLDREELQTWTDEELFILLRTRVRERSGDPAIERVADLTERLLHRRLYKEAASLPLSTAPELTPGETARAERHIARELGLGRGGVLLDVPHKPTMLSTDLNVVFRDGSVVRAGELGPDEGFAISSRTEDLYHSSGRWALFTAERTSIGGDEFRQLVADGVASDA